MVVQYTFRCTICDRKFVSKVSRFGQTTQTSSLIEVENGLKCCATRTTQIFLGIVGKNP